MAGILGAALGMLPGVLAGRAQGQNAREQMLYQRQQDEDEKKRKIAQEALQQQLLKLQIDQAQAGPQTPWQKAGFGTQDEQLGYEGALARLRNPQRTTPEWQEKGYQSFDEWRKDELAGRSPAISPSEARLSDQARQREQAEEAQGVAALNTKYPRPLAGEIGRLFRENRKAGSKLPPGQLTNQVTEALKRMRPDLFPQAPARPGTGDPLKEIMARSMGGGGSMPQVPLSPTPTPPAPASPGSPSLPPLTTQEKQLAQTDPEFKAYLESKGYDEDSF